MIANTHSKDNHGVNFHLLKPEESTEMVPCGHHKGLVEAEKAARNGEWICKECQGKGRGIANEKS